MGSSRGGRCRRRRQFLRPQAGRSLPARFLHRHAGQQVVTALSAGRGARSYPVLDIDLYSPEILADPWSALAEIRKAGPVVWNEHGYWMTGHDRVCRQIMNRPGAIGQEGMISTFFGEEAFISIDEKHRHNALRNVWAGAFSREAVAALASFVRTIANRMLDAVEPALRAGERVEMMAAL